MDNKQMKIPFTKAQLNAAPSSTTVESTSLDALATVKAKDIMKEEEHEEYFETESLLKRKREKLRRKREGEDAYIQFLEEELIELIKVYGRVEKKMMSRKMNLLTDRVNMLKQLKGQVPQNQPEYEGSPENESKSEPKNMVDENGDKDNSGLC